MKKLIYILVVLFTLFSSVVAYAQEPVTAQQIANRCKGEASFAIAECACSVLNREKAGWNKGLVLNAYYAPDVQATPGEVALVENVMNGTEMCNPDLYFMLSPQCTITLGISTLGPVLTVKDPNSNKEIRFFERWYKSRK